jgi:hypothetical protein
VSLEGARGVLRRSPSPWDIRQMCPGALVCAHMSGRFPSAQPWMMRTHYRKRTMDCHTLLVCGRAGAAAHMPSPSASRYAQYESRSSPPPGCLSAPILCTSVVSCLPRARTERMIRERRETAVAIPGVFLIMVHEPPNAWATRRWSLRWRMIEGNGMP